MLAHRRSSGDLLDCMENPKWAEPESQENGVRVYPDGPIAPEEAGR